MHGCRLCFFFTFYLIHYRWWYHALLFFYSITGDNNSWSIAMTTELGNVSTSKLYHYIDVIMTTMASQITSLAVVYSTVYSDADQRKHQSSASLAFLWGIHRDRWIPRTKGQLRGKCFHLMTSSCRPKRNLCFHKDSWRLVTSFKFSIKQRSDWRC